MTEATYSRHLPVHPEVATYIREAQETIRDPDLVLQIEGGPLRLCRRGLGRGRFERAWLAAVVYYENNIGTVATFHFMRSLPEETVLEHRAFYFDGKRFLRDEEGL
jgi:hypothetical protein